MAEVSPFEAELMVVIDWVILSIMIELTYENGGCLNWHATVRIKNQWN